MEEVLQEIRFIPGIEGSFVYVDQLGVVSSDVPDKYDAESVRQMGRVLSRLFDVQSPVCESTQTLGMGFDDMVLTACKIQADAAVITLGDATVNADFVSMTVGSLMRDLVSLVADAQAQASASASPAPDAAPPREEVATPVVESQPAEPPVIPVVESQPPAPQESVDDEEMRSVLAALQECLAKVIGPAAAVVMQDTVAQWSAAGPESLQRLDALSERLCGEIGDPGGEKAFQADVAPILRSAGGTAEVAESAPTVAPGALSEQDLEFLHRPLAEAVGPVAGMMLADATARWRTACGGTAAQLGALVDDLCREIGDTPSEGAFREAVGPAIRSLAQAVQPTATASGGGSEAVPEDMDAVLEQLGELLAQGIGPISQLVMGDAVAEWRSGGSSAEQLGVLVERLCAEISDDGLARGFRQKAQGLLKG